MVERVVHGGGEFMLMFNVTRLLVHIADHMILKLWLFGIVVIFGVVRF